MQTPSPPPHADNTDPDSTPRDSGDTFATRTEVGVAIPYLQLGEDGMKPAFATPFADLFPPIPAAEREAMAEDIRANGVLEPIVTYLSPTWGPAILDGVNRWTISAELGLDCPVRHLGDMTDEEARDRAEAGNLHRRHLTPEVRKALRKARAERVAEKRRRGMSYRAIAAEEGVDPKTVEKDVKKASTVDGSTVEPEDGKVMGRDGKVRPAKSARSVGARKVVGGPPANPERADPPGVSDGPRPVVIADGPLIATECDPLPVTVPAVELVSQPGVMSPDEYRAKTLRFAEEKLALRPRWDAAVTKFRSLVEELADLAEGPSGVHLRSLLDGNGEPFWKRITYQKGPYRRGIVMFQPLLAAVDMLKSARPDRLCSACNGSECPACRNTGILPCGVSSDGFAPSDPVGQEGASWD